MSSSNEEKRSDLAPGQHPNTDYPSGVGLKFNVDGSVRRFPGNTIICHLAPESPAYRALLGLHDRLAAHAFSSLYTLLPPPSWHMTLFEGVCDQVREPDLWPADVGLAAPIEACHALFADRLRRFVLPADPTYRVRIVGLQPLFNGISLRFTPTDSEENRRLRALRDRLSDCLGIRHPAHESYTFHLSIAYFIRHPMQAERQSLAELAAGYLREMPKEIAFGRPEYCHFDDMFAFRRQFYLGQA